MTSSNSSILDFLEESHILSVAVVSNKNCIEVREACDGYSATNLDKAQLLKLIEELTELAGKLK